MAPLDPFIEHRSKPSDGTRRSDRVNLAIPIEAIGTDLTRGRLFCEKGQTTTVSRHGAAIALNYALATDQVLTIRCLGSNREVRVVGLIAGQSKELVYGVALVDPTTNPWNVEFPALTDSDEILARTLLQCNQCQTVEVAHLNEIEIHVFEANRRIQRFCKTCSATTSWKQPSKVNLTIPVERADKSSAEPTPQPEGREKRRHARVKTNVPACVRQSGMPDEIVTCENLSRGGIHFRASRLYPKGVIDRSGRSALGWQREHFCSFPRGAYPGESRGLQDRCGIHRSFSQGQAARGIQRIAHLCRQKEPLLKIRETLPTSDRLASHRIWRCRMAVNFLHREPLR